MPGWRVWGELRRRPHVELVWAYLTGHRGHIERLEGSSRRITIEATLDQRNRRAVLAHELVHEERDILFDDNTPLALIRKEEAWVTAETVRRLVPIDHLEQLVRQAVLDDRSVTWRDVAEWFDVPRDVSEQAIAQLQQRARARHPAQHVSSAGF